ncbi:unnamed protein product, partial [marine sediment metagenome]
MREPHNMTLKEEIEERQKRREKKEMITGIIACSGFTAFFVYAIWVCQDIVPRVALGLVWFLLYVSTPKVIPTAR